MFSLFWKILGIKMGKWVILSPGIFSWVRKNVSLGDGVWIGVGYQIITSENWSFTVWKGTHINRFFTCGAVDITTIGEDCLLSYNVNIHAWTHSFGKDEPPWIHPDFTAPIHIWNRCFIWCGAVILKWVTLWDNCVVWANAVVTKSFPSGSVIGGNPAILIKSL